LPVNCSGLALAGRSLTAGENFAKQKTQYIPGNQKSSAFKQKTSEFIEALGNKERDGKCGQFSDKKFLNTLVFQDCIHSSKV
jgi:hypothetical protein